MLTDEALEHYVEMNRVNAKKLALDADLVLVHDVQPATLVEHRGPGSRWVWRCHFDASRAQRRAWTFLRPWINQYDAAIFSLPRFGRRLGIPQLRHRAVDRSAVGEEPRPDRRARSPRILRGLGLTQDRPHPAAGGAVHAPPRTRSAWSTPTGW